MSADLDLTDALLAHLQRRVVQDAMDQAEAGTWERAALRLETALPRPGDFLGREVTPQQRDARVQDLQRMIAGCRHRASLSRDQIIARAATCCLLPDGRWL